MTITITSKRVQVRGVVSFGACATHEAPLKGFGRLASAAQVLVTFSHQRTPEHENPAARCPLSATAEHGRRSGGRWGFSVYSEYSAVAARGFLGLDRTVPCLGPESQAARYGV